MNQSLSCIIVLLQSWERPKTYIINRYMYTYIIDICYVICIMSIFIYTYFGWHDEMFVKVCINNKMIFFSEIRVYFGIYQIF